MKTESNGKWGLSAWLAASFVLLISAMTAIWLALSRFQEVALACISSQAPGPECAAPGPILMAGVALGLVGIVILAVVLFRARKKPTSEKRRFPLVVGFGVAGLLIAAILLKVLVPISDSGVGMKSVDSGGHAQASTASREAGGEDSSDLEERAATTATPAVSHPFPEVPTSRKDMDLESDPFTAESVEEQAWLDRNGYPNAKQWEALNLASDMQLLQAAEAGDTAARALYDQRRLIAGDTEAIDSMINLGARGSLFSLELLASTLAGPGNDPVTAYALTRVVEMRGNYRIGMGRDMMFRRPLTNLERVEGEQAALDLYGRIGALERSIRGGSASQVDPRPIGGG